jgi:hypothetical protein
MVVCSHGTLSGELAALFLIFFARNVQKLRLHLALIKASLSTENCCAPIGWFLTHCGAEVTAF